ncbi:hypothetical protein CAEBREN_03215 [Caenorhabditis brenneri]|uniref:Uncharacterized protein n=1 Tax=Caenorhabditis brenneri TaxID=135651 RepID=G0NX52_CAEBE|nr:hypothetical protein CAEBREN_03215 [Caenorhabditis brenneri]
MGENRQGPQRRSMAQASGPSSDVQGTSPPSRTATVAVSVTPALAASSLAPSDPRRSTCSTTVAAGASIPATDTPSTSGPRRTTRASAGIPGWWRQPSEESEAAPSTSTTATRSRKRASDVGTSSSKKVKKDCK